MPIAIPEVKDYTALPETEQVKYSAREFFAQLIAGDARSIVGIDATNRKPDWNLPP